MARIPRFNCNDAIVYEPVEKNGIYDIFYLSGGVDPEVLKNYQWSVGEQLRKVSFWLGDTAMGWDDLIFKYD
jgi:hypothetical protein